MSNALTLPIAQRIIHAALSGPRTSPARLIAVAVCDSGGHPLALAREASAPPLLAHIATAKAFTCVVYGKPTGELAEIADQFPTWFNGISRISQSAMGSALAGSRGGVLVRDASGAPIGAVGVAGETGDRDEELARLGIAAVGLTT